MSTTHHLIRNKLLVMGIVLTILFGSAGYGLASSPLAPDQPSAGPIVDLRQGEYDLAVIGNRANGYLSEIITSADFNNDGIEDLLIGAAGHDHHGQFTGAAYLILGSASLTGDFDLVDQLPNLTIYGPAQNSVLGHSVAGGDVNGDGIKDLIISADVFGDDQGAVYVILGHATSFNTPRTIDLKNPGSDVPAVTILGASPGDRFGRSVASADINDDGIEDIIVGAYNESPGGRVEAGAVHVILGSNSFSSASPTTIDLSTDDTALTILGAAGAAGGMSLNSETLYATQGVSPLADDFRMALAEFGDRLGRSVAVGDVNNDGIADIIAGAYGANVDGKVDAGKTYVFFGKDTYSSSSPVTIDLNANPGLADITLTGIDADDQSGFYVASGDFNHDNWDDILISAYFADGPNNTGGDQTGEVYAVYGGPSLTGEHALAARADVTIYGANSGARLGRSLASGDVNGDGYADMILGSSRANPDGRVGAGAVYVIYGRPEIPTPILLSQPMVADIYIMGDGREGVICTTPVSPSTDCVDETGFSSTAGDINGDGVDDIIAGALYANNPNGPIQDAGAAYVIFGDAPTSVLLTPKTSSIAAGDPITYALAAVNKFGAWDVTQFATFTASAGAGGSWSGGVYTSANPGNWTITGTYQGLSDTASLEVIAHGTPVSLTIAPKTRTAGVGGIVVYSAIAEDADGITWNATGATTFSIEAGAGGSWAGNVYTAGNPGTWTVTASYQGLTDTATVTVVVHDDPVSVTLAPKTATVAPGEKVAYSLVAKDAADVTWEVTDEAVYSIPGAAGGSWMGNEYTAQITGTWTVTGTYMGLSDTATLTVSDEPIIEDPGPVYLPLVLKNR